MSTCRYSRFRCFPSHMLSWFLGGWSRPHLWLSQLKWVMLSIVSPTRPHFSLNAHHIAGNSDLPTFTFISFLATTLAHLGRQNHPRHISTWLDHCALCCALNWPLRESFTCMFHVCYPAGWMRWVQMCVFDLQWFHHDTQLSPLLHLCLFLNGAQPWRIDVNVNMSISFSLVCFLKKQTKKTPMSGNKSFGFHFTFSLKLQTDRGKNTKQQQKNPSRLNFCSCFERLYVFRPNSAMLHIAFFMLS